MTDAQLLEEYAQVAVVGATPPVQLTEQYAQVAAPPVVPTGPLLVWYRAKNAGGVAANPIAIADESGNGFDGRLTATSIVDLGALVPTAATDGGHISPVGPDGGGNLAIDGNAATYFTNPGVSGWVRLQLSVAGVATGYTIRRRDDLPARNPTAWTFEGSNDGTTFTTLDTRSGVTWGVVGATNSYTFVNTTAYLYYRLNITNNGGDAYLSVAELGLSATVDKGLHLVSGSLTIGKTDFAVATGSVSTTFGSGSDGSWPFLIDGNVGSFWTTAGVATGNAVLQLVAAQAATTYTVTARNDGLVNRAPRDWTFAGSNDGSSWTTLDTRSGVTGWTASQARTYTFANATAYLYYRINVTANNGDTYLSFSGLTIGRTAVDWPRPLEREMWLVVRSNASGGSAWVLGTSGTDSIYPFTDGKVYDDSFITQRQSFTPTMPINVKRLYRVTATSAGAWTAYLDEVSQLAVTGKTLGEPLVSQIAKAFTGDILEVQILSRASTPSEIADKITYFNNEHGMSVPGGSVSAPVLLADTAAGSDSLTAVQTAAPVIIANLADTAAGADALSSSGTRVVALSDVATGADALAVAEKRIADTAVGSDTVSTAEKRVTLADTAVGSDTVVTSHRLVSDTAWGADLLAVSQTGDKAVTFADTAVGSDQIVVTQTGRVNDFAVGTDQVIVDFRPGCRVSLEHSRHLYPWTDHLVAPVTFGRAQAIVLPDGKFGATVNIEPLGGVGTWTLRVYKLDSNLVVTGYVDVPTSINGFAAISTPIGDGFSARIHLSRSTTPPSRTYEVVDVDLAGSAPIVLAHSGATGGGAGIGSYSDGVGANYFIGSDITVYTSYTLAVMKASTLVYNSSPYPSGTHVIWGWDPTAAQAQRFPYVAQLSTNYTTHTLHVDIGESVVADDGSVTHTSHYVGDMPMTNGDTYWIRPVRLEGGLLTVLERVYAATFGAEIGWQVNVYDLTTSARVATIGEVLEPAVHPQYLAENPDVQFDGFGNFMVFADKGPNWGTSADWGTGTLHPGYEREVLYWSAGGQHLSTILAPRPTTDGHGEMDALTARSTGGSFVNGVWAMASTMTDLFEPVGSFYATDIWSGFLLCGGGGTGGGGGGGTGGGGTGAPDATFPDTATGHDDMDAVWFKPQRPGGPPATGSYQASGPSNLGCGENTVAIYDRGGIVRLFPIDALTSIQYTRVRDDISEALLHVPTSADCCGDLAKIEPVRHEMVIFRDGQRVWEGPITRIGFSQDDVEIAAKDVMFWAFRTIIRAGYDNSYPNIAFGTDRIGGIMRAEMARKEGFDPPINVLPYLQIHTTDDTARTSRKTLPYQKTVFEELDDVAAKQGLDYTVIGRAIHVHDTSYVLGETGLATEADFLGGIIVTSYGMDLSTYSAATDGQGNFGVSQVDMSYYGEVEMLATAYDEEATEAPTQSELNSQAARNQNGRYPMPIEVRVPDSSQISPMSETFSFDSLVPGVKVPLLAMAGCKRLRQDQKIDSITVRQDAQGEVITMTMVPFPQSYATGDSTFTVSTEPGLDDLRRGDVID